MYLDNTTAQREPRQGRTMGPSDHVMEASMLDHTIINTPA